MNYKINNFSPKIIYFGERFNMIRLMILIYFMLKTLDQFSQLKFTKTYRKYEVISDPIIVI